MNKSNHSPQQPAVSPEGRMSTSRDVAQLAGVSQSSVCRVFDPKWSERIRPALREKILAAARQLGYSPNALARSLTAHCSGIIGVVISEDFNEFYYDLMRRITNELQQQGMRVMLFNAAPYRDVNQVLRKLMEYRVDGIIITAAALSCTAEPVQRDISTPLVLVNVYCQQPFCSSVTCDNYGGSRSMAAYLCRCGGQRFAYLSAEKSRYFDVADRKRGFLDELAERGIHDCQVAAGDYSYESGKELARQLLASPHPPDTVFSCGSRMAYGFLDAARYEFGLRVPSELSVAAYDDTFASDLEPYQLTAVQQPSQEMALTAIRLLQQEMNHPSAPFETVYASPSLKIRSSVRRCGADAVPITKRK